MGVQTNPAPRSMRGTFAERPSPKNFGDIYTVTDAAVVAVGTVYEVALVGGVAAWVSMTGPTGPQGPAGGANFSQSGGVVLAADSSTSSAVYSTLTSFVFTTTGGLLLIQFTATSSNSANNIDGNVYRVTIDGGSIGSVGFTSNGAGHECTVSIVRRVSPVAAGAHTIAIQWKTAGGTLSCNPATNESHFCGLTVQEVLV